MDPGSSNRRHTKLEECWMVLIPMELQYVELAEGTQLTEKPHLRYKDTNKKDMKMANNSVNNWEICD
ncbi:hypothetical protein CHS0354_015231 [Potamilus streckersoni]|uniref:Uncharacterized protein n=1 Tax=Potamilus streckersoni TaxID=2493646 RepID=A0AAE0RRE9_9BIVA|nr:hypothetical protein CHS0354_015231 [Potamilus streckersoni]